MLIKASIRRTVIYLNENSCLVKKKKKEVDSSFNIALNNKQELCKEFNDKRCKSTEQHDKRIKFGHNGIVLGQ